MKILAAIGHLILAGAIAIILFFVGGVIADTTGIQPLMLMFGLPVLGVIPYLIYACKRIFGDSPQELSVPTNNNLTKL